MPAPIRVSAQPVARSAARGNSPSIKVSELTIFNLGDRTPNGFSLNPLVETGQPVCFHTLPHSFALMKTATALFSCASALLVQNMGDGGAFIAVPSPLLQSSLGAPLGA